MKKIQVKLLVSRTDGTNRGDVIFVPENEHPHMLAAEQIDPEFEGETIDVADDEPEAETPAEPKPAKAPKQAVERAVRKPKTEKAVG